MEEEKEEERGEIVDRRIEEMVSFDLKTSEIVVEAEAETAYGSVELFRVVEIRPQGLNNVLPGQILEMDVLIFHNGVKIIEVKGAVKGIGING